MAANVDHRIVQMEFDNRQFERNIAQSTKSVEELKEAMDFEETSQGLEKFSRTMDHLSFQNLETGLDKLVNKFTGLGDASEYVLSRIRSGIEGAARSVENFIRGLSIDQIPVGQNKYDQLNKAVMTIVSGGKATEEQAYTTMERVMEYTKQTSHDFNTMVGQISGLTSLGKGLEESERLIESIGNAATYAGGSAQQAAMSMSVLTKAFSADWLGYEQFLQLSQTSRVITDKWRQQALEAAEAVGTLTKKNDRFYVSVKGQKAVEVTAQNLENTLRNRWLTGQVLAKIYENYAFGKDLEELKHPEDAMDSFGKTAYLTGQRALTLLDALNAMKESVSSGWMNTFRLLFGDVSEAAEHFTNIADRVIDSLEKIQDFRNNILTAFATAGGRTNILQLLLGDYENETEKGVFGLMDLLDGAGSILFDGFKDFMMLFARPIDKAAVEADPKYFTTYLSYLLSDAVKNIQNFMNGIRDFFNESIDVNGKTKTRLEVIHEIVQGIAGALKFGYDIVTEVINFIETISGNLTPSFDAVIGFLGDLGAEIYNTADATGQAGTIRKFFTDLADKLKPVTDGINNVVISITNFLRMLLGLDDDTEKRGENLKKIGDFLLIIGDVIAKITGPVLNFLSSIIDLVTELFKDGVSKETFKEFGKKLGEAFKEMMKSFADNLPESLGFLGNWIKDLFGLWEDESQGDSKSFFTFLRKIFTGGFSNFGELLGSLTQGMSLTRAIETGFGFGAAFNFLNTVAGWFKGINLYNVIMAFLGVTAVWKIISLVHQAGKAIKTIGGFFDDVGGNLMAGISGRYQWFTEKLLDIAKSVGIFVACIVALGSMDTGRLIQGIIALTVVLGLVIGLWILLEKTAIATSSMTQQILMETLIVTLAGAVAAICVSLSVLMLAIIPLASDWKKMATAIIGFAAFIAIIGGFLVIMLNAMDKFTFSVGGTNQWSGIGKMAAMMFTLAGAVAMLAAGISVLVVALTPLALTGWEGMLRAVIAFGAILAMVGAFMVIMINQMDTLAFTMGGGKGGWSGMGKMAVMMLTLSASVALLAVGIGALIVAVTPLAVMSWGGFARAMAGLGIIFIELGAMMKYLQTLTVSDKTASLKIAGLAGFALSVGILIFALTPLALMDWGSWARALVGLGVVLAELIGFMWLAGKAGVTGVALGGFTAFAISIGILLFSLQPIANMDWGAWARGMIGLGVVLTELIGFMWLADKAKVTGVGLASFIGFALSIAILIFALKPLAEMSPEGYQRALVGLAAVMLEVLILLGLINEMKPDLGSAGATLLLLVGLGIAMVLFGIALNEVKDISWEKIAAFAGGLSVLLVAIAGAGILANAAGIQGMLILAVGLAAIMGVIALLAPMLIGSIIGALRDAAGDLAVLAGVLETFSGHMNNVDEGGIDKGKVILEKLKDIFGIILSFAFGSFSMAVYDLMSAVGQLTIISGELEIFATRIQNVSEEGMTTAQKVFTDLGVLLDTASNCVPAGFSTEALLSAVGSMTIVSGELKTFSDRIAEVSLMSFLSFKLMAATIRSTLETELADISSFIQRSNDFGTVMFNLGTGLESFQNHTGNVGDPKENSAVQLIKELSACASDMDIIAKMDLDNLTAQMSGLGGAMMLYAKGAQEATGLEVGNTPDVTAAVTLLSSISKSLTDNGGFAIPTNMPDEDALGLFGAQLAALAGALIEFEQAGQGLGAGTDKALETLDFFQKLKTKLIETGFSENLDDTINAFGEGDAKVDVDALTEFGWNIEQLGLALKAFAEATTYTDEETGEVKAPDFTNATAALQSFADIATQLNAIEITGIEQWWNGDGGEKSGTNYALQQMAIDIEALGVALGDFYLNTSTFNEANDTYEPMSYDHVIEILNTLVEAATNLGAITLGGLRTMLLGKPITIGALATDIEALGVALQDFGINTKMFAEVQANGKPLDYSNVLDMLTKLVSAATDLSAIEIGGIRSWWSGKKQTLGDFSGDLEQLAVGLNDFGKALNGDPESGKPGFDGSKADDAISSLDKMIDFMQNMRGKLPKVGGLSNILSTIANGREMNLGDLGPMLGPLGEGLGDFGVGISKASWDNPEGVDAALSALDSLLGIMIKLGQWNTAEGNAFAGIDVLTQFTQDLTQPFTNSFTGQEYKTTIVDNIITFMQRLSEGFGTFANTADDMKSLSTKTEVFKTFAEGLNTLAEAVKTTDFDKIGKTLTTDIATDLLNGTSDVINKADSLVNQLYETLNVSITDYELLGKNIAIGLANGMNVGTTDYVVPAATAMGEAAYAATAGAVESNSPSRLFMELGAFMGEGTAIGIQKSTGEVGKSAGLMGDVAIEKAKDMIALISRVMAEDVDANPTITPVLDLTDVEAGMALFRQGLGGYELGIDTNYASSHAAQLQRGNQNGSETPLPADYTGIYQHINDLGEKIQQMGDSIKQMKLVLDTGVIAGGVTDRVDELIGQKIWLLNRGNTV